MDDHSTPTSGKHRHSVLLYRRSQRVQKAILFMTGTKRASVEKPALLLEKALRRFGKIVNSVVRRAKPRLRENILSQNTRATTRKKELHECPSAQTV